MNLITPKYEILSKINREEILKNLEIAGRTCYKSEDKMNEESATKFINMIVKRGHMSVIEHEKVSVKFYCDRGVSHELVRHRIGSYSQESTRYCNYSTGKKGLNFVDMKHHFKNPKSIDLWLESLIYVEKVYNKMIEYGEQPQIARSVLPNCLKTEIVATFNLREWLLVFTQRCSAAAHPQMRELMIPLQKEFQKLLPEIYGSEK